MMPPPTQNEYQIAYYKEVEILVTKVPVMVKIGGNLVENWCQIGEKGRHLPAFSDPTPCFPLSDKGSGLRGGVNKQSFQAWLA